MKKIHNSAAGIDIGARKIFIGLENKEVVAFETFTSDFRQASAYLSINGITTVAMEATGSYWFILYDILSADGFDVWLVDGRQTRQVPGRKTDVKDCQWIQQLHSHGLLNRCFVAEGDLREIRSYERIREDHIQSAAMHVNHMQKALVEMNIRLPEVINQVQGTSGLAMIRAMLAGETKPEHLLNLCHTSLKKNKSKEILSALEGFYTNQGLFALKQAFEGYTFYQERITECDKEIEEVLKRINGGKSDYTPKSRKAIRHHKPDIDNFGGYMLTLFSGKDATTIPGITDYSWLKIYSETGTDLERWPTEKHFTSWLGLSPGQNHSGKKKKNAKKKGRPSAGQIFRIIGQSLIESKNLAFGAFGRRMKGRKGPQIAIKAVARKVAVQYWRLMVKGEEFLEKGVKHYEQILLAQKQKYIKKLAKELNVEISEKLHAV